MRHILRVNVSHLQRSEHVFTFPRATPWAVQVAGLSGRRKMCELMWVNQSVTYVTELYPTFLTLWPVVFLLDLCHELTMLPYPVRSSPRILLGINRWGRYP